MKQKPIYTLILASIFLALSIILPRFISPIPEIGQRLLPMHIPVLLCGFFCGWKYGLIVGVLAPLLKTLFPPGPPLFPIAIAMSFELGTYGFMTAFLHHLFPKKHFYTYITLICAMIVGRIIYGLVMTGLLSIDGKSYTISLFISSTVILAIPGIILQLLLIPTLVISLSRYMDREESYA